jgi:hypothetical protein
LWQELLTRSAMPDNRRAQPLLWVLPLPLIVAALYLLGRI